MPYLSIQTNQVVQTADINSLIQKASQTTADILGKPESYVMVAFASAVPMVFAGNNGATAYLELKSLGLPEDKTQQLSQRLCDLVSTELGVEKDRIYIEFSNAKRHMWGWNGATF